MCFKMITDVCFHKKNMSHPPLKVFEIPAKIADKDQKYSQVTFEGFVWPWQ